MLKLNPNKSDGGKPRAGGSDSVTQLPDGGARIVAPLTVISDGDPESPETVSGVEYEEPGAPGGTRDSDTSDPRRTRSGRIDGRTKAGRSARAETPQGILKPTASTIKLEELLYSLHLMGSEILKVKELELDKDDAKKLSDAIVEVGKHYAVEFDPKKVAVLNLIAVSGAIYAPRVIAYMNNRQRKAPLVAIPKPQAPPQQTARHEARGPIDLSNMSPADLDRMAATTMVL